MLNIKHSKVIEIHREIDRMKAFFTTEMMDRTERK